MALDEGLASPDDTVPVYYGERNVFWVHFVCKGYMSLKVVVIINCSTADSAFNTFNNGAQ